jgi:hypothetical protein
MKGAPKLALLSFYGRVLAAILGSGLRECAGGRHVLAPCGLDGLGECGDDFEEVAYDAVVGYFEDWGFGVFVDGDDALRALHADEVLDGSGDANGEVEFGCDGLARGADLTFDGKPAVVADGPRCGYFCAE